MFLRRPETGTREALLRRRATRTGFRVAQQTMLSAARHLPRLHRNEPAAAKNRILSRIRQQPEHQHPHYTIMWVECESIYYFDDGWHPQRPAERWSFPDDQTSPQPLVAVLSPHPLTRIHTCIRDNICLRSPPTMRTV